VKNFIWLILTLTILITLHLKIAMAGSFGISLGFLLIPGWFYFTFKIKFLKFGKREFALMSLLFLLPFINLHIWNWSEFFKTYCQYILAYVFVIRTIDKPISINELYIKRALLYFQIILLVVVVFQYVFVRILGFNEFYNIFGDLQLYYQRNEPGYNRMKAFYLEPSYLGFIAVNIFWASYYLERKFKLVSLNLIFTLVILFFTKSAFGFLALFIIILYELYYTSSKKSSLYFIGAFGILIILIFSFSNQFIEVFRLNEFSTNKNGEITSGFMRVILPIQVIYQMFIDGYYFGLTFGQLDLYVENAFRGFGETAISNSFILIIGYFGVIGFLIYGFFIFLFFKTKNRIFKAFIILTFINLNNSGAFVTSQYAFVAFLMPILAIKLYEEKDIDNYSCQK
jgi:hypothetical protein